MVVRNFINCIHRFSDILPSLAQFLWLLVTVFGIYFIPVLLFRIGPQFAGLLLVKLGYSSAFSPLLFLILVSGHQLLGDPR